MRGASGVAFFAGCGEPAEVRESLRRKNENEPVSLRFLAVVTGLSSANEGLRLSLELELDPEIS